MSSHLSLLVVVGLLVGAAYSRSPAYRYDERRYFCRDRHGYVGDCDGGYYHRGEAYGYGSHHDGVYVGRGYYNLAGGRHAELVCDFYKDGGVRGPVYNIVWRKMNNLRSRGGSGRDYVRGRSSFDDWYSNSDYQYSVRVFTHDSRSTMFIRDNRFSDEGTYRCYGMTRTGYGGRERVVYMDVDFYPKTSRLLYKK